MSKTKLVLFDVDGTLVLTGRAGVRAMTRAMADVFGVADAFTDLSLAGRTDWFLLASALARADQTLDDRGLARFRDAYIPLLEEEVLKPGEGCKGIMPGVRALLDSLAERDDIVLGLLTGNFVDAARIKLEYFDLWRYFQCGAYGDDAHDRNDLVPVAVERAPKGAEGLDRVFVVGDTPHDIACAAAAGATSIAVATGGFQSDALRTAGADVVFEDLSDVSAFLGIVGAARPETK
jgi:phosphoglycolate phosphatase